MILVCLANFSFGAEALVSSALTAANTISSPSKTLVAGRLELSIPLRQSVSAPAPFAVAKGDPISFCVEAATDAADLFVQLNERRLWLEKSPCNKAQGANVYFTLTSANGLSESRPPEKIVTLVLAPE